MKKQIVVIHGGDTFKTYEEYLSFLQEFTIDTLDYFKGRGWKDTLQETLGEGYEVVTPSMPNKINAKYSEWKIWFEKIVPLLEEKVILIGHSLGGIFLAKYLSENNFPKHILATFLIAAPFDEKDTDESLADFILSEDLSKLIEQGGEVYFYHSTDDGVVPFTDFEKYREKLPGANYMQFEDRGHFRQLVIPELITSITEGK